jgi:hypothetical protein
MLHCLRFVPRYPIGTFIFWKTKDTLRSYKELGHHKLPRTPEGDYAQYILDGQQRITSLYAIRKGLRITKDGKEIDYKDIYINLDYNASTDEQIAITQKEDGKAYVAVHDLLIKNMRALSRPLPLRISELGLRQCVKEKRSFLTETFPGADITVIPVQLA